MLGAGLVLALEGAVQRPGGHRTVVHTEPPPAPLGPLTAPSTIPAHVTPPPPPPLPPIPGPHPGPPRIVGAGRPNGRQVALTVDDGTSDEVVGAYAEFAERSGIALTFCPNGVNRKIWEPRAKILAPLIARGQVQVVNHTWSHPDLRRLSDATIVKEIEQNEQWIQDTFGITARPWFRPPFGSRSPHSDAVAAGLGYTQILLWNGTLGDATVESPEELMGLARQYLQPGTIMLGHANHPTVTTLFDRIQQLLNDRDLEPVTLDTMFGSSRAIG
ncbi:MAG: hypothetical protein NVS3B21_14540 [Acidimicrobiales bacterium]